MRLILFMGSKAPPFVKKATVYMCMFDACFDKDKKCVAKNCKNIVSNINPEIGKSRPVIIVHRHRRNKLAIVVPFTTKKPNQELEKTLLIPPETMPGVLGKKECWALCDMIQTVSIDRLENIYSGKNNTYYRHIKPNDSRLPNDYFIEIRKILCSMFS